MTMCLCCSERELYGKFKILVSTKVKSTRRCEYRKFIDMRIKASEIPISLHADQSQDISIAIDDLNFTKTIKHVSYRRWHYGF